MKFRNTVVSIFFLITVLLVILILIKSFPSKGEISARVIIHSYIEAFEPEIKPGTDQYRILMRKIIWGEIPELNDVGTDFINTLEELKWVNDYAWKYSGYKDLYGGYQEEIDLNEAVIPTLVNQK